MAGLMSLLALEGAWRLERRIVHSDDSEFKFEGEARFARSGKRLIHDEEGLLSGVPGQEPIRATRRYIWMREGDRIEVHFHDMRPFHTIPMGAEAPETTYLCSPDRYRVSYDFSDMKAWRATWKVEGPKKSYVMESLYRPDDGKR